MSGPYEKVDEFFIEAAELGAGDVLFALRKLQELVRSDPANRLTGQLDFAMKKGIVVPGKTFVNKLLFACALLLLSGAFAGQTYPQRQPPFDALEGLDPVMLVQGKEVQGELNITLTRGLFRYLFANAANKAVFEQDPARYEIQLDGHCARMGAPTGGHPDLFTVYQGRIYLFGSGECKKQFDAAPQRFFEPEYKSATTAATAAALKKGQALVEQAVTAMGGAQLLDGLRSYQEKDIVTPQVDYGFTLAFPDRVRKDQRYGAYQDAAVLNRETSEALLIARRDSLPLTTQHQQVLWQEVSRKPLVILRARKQADFKAVALGAGLAGETATEQVAVEVGGVAVQLGLEPKTGRILRLTYTGRGPGGAYGQVVQSFADFRAVEGLTLPFKTATRFNGQPWPQQTFTVESIVINGKLDPALFAKPAAGKAQ